MFYGVKDILENLWLDKFPNSRRYEDKWYQTERFPFGLTNAEMAVDRITKGRKRETKDRYIIVPKPYHIQ